MWSKWLCWLLTRHRLEVRWANFHTDWAGWRCLCGTKQTQEILATKDGLFVSIPVEATALREGRE